MDLIPRGFDDLFDDFMAPMPPKPPKHEHMRCDIYEKDNKYHIEMDVPGFTKDDIKIEVNKDSLIITAEKEEKHDEKDGKKYIHRERRYGKYQRSFYLQDLDSEDINAEFKDGVLAIVVPKKEEKETKKYIEIK